MFAFISTLLGKNPLASIIGGISFVLLSISGSFNWYFSSQVDSLRNDQKVLTESKTKIQEALNTSMASNTRLTFQLGLLNGKIESMAVDQALAEKTHDAYVAQLKVKFDKERARILSTKPKFIPVDCKSKESVAKANDALQAVEVLFGGSK